MNVSRVFSKPYVYATTGIFFTYLVVNIILSEFYLTISYIPYFASQIYWLEFGVALILALAIALLVSVNIVAMMVKYRENKTSQGVRASSCATAIGTLGGIATGVCPACVTGIIPFLFSSVGLSAGFVMLPFRGLEIQAATLAILICTLWYIKEW